jgi:hypothetical protein
MKLIGLAGPAGVGKDTVADYLVTNHGFTKFSFSDPLYEEVAQAFGIDKALLYDREKKEQPMEGLNYWFCTDKDFQRMMFKLLAADGVKYPGDWWPSPRWVLQRWGTDYRRAQDPEYWIKKAVAFVEMWWKREQERQHDADYVPSGGLVNCSVRFPNERSFVQQYNGEVWHIRREGWDKVMGSDSTKNYVAEAGLPPAPEDKVVFNNGTIEQLHTAASLLLGSGPGVGLTCEKPREEAALYVACTACGIVHLGYTRAQAVQEVAEYNEVARLHGLTPIAVEQYETCDNCGGRQFKDASGEGQRKYAPVIINGLC